MKYLNASRTLNATKISSHIETGKSFIAENLILSFSPAVGFIAGLLLVMKIDEKNMKNAEKVRVTQK